MNLRIEFSITFLFLLLFLTIKNAESKWQNYEKDLLQSEEHKQIFSLLEPKSLFQNHKTVYGVYGNNDTTTNDTCTRDIAAFNGALIKQKLWAIQMLDASSKIPSGLLKGNIIDIGMYDECIEAEGTFLNIEIKGRHCMYSVKVTSGNVSIPIDPTMSICVPRTCSSEDIKSVLSSTIKLINKFKKLDVEISAVSCARVDQKVWDFEFIFWTIILGSLIGFLVMCSICELHIRRSPAGSYRNSVILSFSQFSFQKNAAAILNTEMKESSIPILSGLKVLSMAWVVLGHEFFNQLLNITVNNIDILPWIQSWKSLYVFNGLYAVDTFFTISGFLMTFVFMKQKQKRFNVFLHYIHRYIRLTPAVIGLIIITIVYVPKIGSGARWDLVMDMYATSCREKVWPTLLYVQNTVDVDNLCLGHLWYLAVDTQLFWISPIILYPLYRKPKIGLIILSMLLAISIIIPAYIIGSNHYHAISSFRDLNQTEITFLFQELYEKTYNRATPWLLGILLGYEVACNNRILTRKTIFIGWSVTIAAFIFCCFGFKTFTDPDYVYNATWETFYAVASKPFWAFVICWIIFACTNNCAGPITTLLSWKFFLPLSRLSYCVYLVHFVVQMVRIAAVRTPSYFTDLYVWHAYLGNLIVSVVVAFIFCLVFESPAVAFEKVLFQRRERCTEIQKQNKRNYGKIDEDEIIHEDD